MCGRYAITASAEHLAVIFDAMWEEACRELASSSLPRFNIAPTQMAPVVRTLDGARRLSWLRWGLVPSWADDPSIGSRMINARLESAAEKPSFRKAWRQRRCLVPATHFYEWPRVGARKQPTAITAMANEPGAEGAVVALAFAGLWESWHGELESFTILTTEADDVMRPIHDRMPLILPRDRWAQWLDPDWPVPGDPAGMREWLAPSRADPIRAYPVTSLVNAPRNESRACLEPMPVQKPNIGL